MHLVEVAGHVVEPQHVVVAGELGVREAEALAPLGGALGAIVADLRVHEPGLLLGHVIVEPRRAGHLARLEHRVDAAARVAREPARVVLDLLAAHEAVLAARAHGRSVAHEAVLGAVRALGERAVEALAVGDRGDVLDAPGPDPHAQPLLARGAQIAARAVLDVGQRDDHGADPAPLELGEHLAVHVLEARRPDPRAGRHLAEPEAHVLRARMRLHQAAARDAHLERQRLSSAIGG